MKRNPLSKAFHPFFKTFESLYVPVTSLCTEITSETKIDLILAFSEI